MEKIWWSKKADKKSKEDLKSLLSPKVQLPDSNTKSASSPSVKSKSSVSNTIEKSIKKKKSSLL